MPKANTMPRSCTMFALSSLTDIPDEVIIKTFKKTKCYKPSAGSDFFLLNKTLDKLGVKYEDHFTGSNMAEQIKQCTGFIVGAKPLSSMMPEFRKNNHLVHVLVCPGPNDKDNEYHTVGVSYGMYINLEVEKLENTWYLGHYTILGINGDKWSKI